MALNFNMTLGQRKTNMLAERRTDEQKCIGPRSETNEGPTKRKIMAQRWSNVGLLSWKRLA